VVATEVEKRGKREELKEKRGGGGEGGWRKGGADNAGGKS